MTSPRSHLVDPAAAGFYHCISRCVRRAFLCGEDALTGRSVEHRKQWVEDRLLELAEILAVGIYAYAVMSNHLHVVVYVDPSATLAWSPDEVARRWVRPTPIRVDGEVDEEACAARATALAGNAERIAVLRERLGSLSWFMRFLNEPIARRANQEDGCTGHFWEARSKCQALLDDAAVLACMAYVDLNPVRAGLAAELTDSAHTAIQRRLLHAPSIKNETPLEPVAGTVTPSAMPASLAEYLQLADWTGRIVRPDKRGMIDPAAPPVLNRLGLDAGQWHAQATGIEQRYWRAVGAVDALIEEARAIGQCWLKGSGSARIRGCLRSDRCLSRKVPARLSSAGRRSLQDQRLVAALWQASTVDAAWNLRINEGAMVAVASLPMLPHDRRLVPVPVLLYFPHRCRQAAAGKKGLPARAIGAVSWPTLR